MQWRVALLQVSRNVLQHHDGVIHHKTSGDGHRHQRQVVDREPGQVHHPKCADQRQRYGNRRNDRGTDPTQEQKRNQDHQRDGDQQLVLHVSDRRANGLRAVSQDRDIKPCGQVISDAWQQRLDPVDHLDDVGTGLALNIEQYRLVLVSPGCQPFILRTVDDLSHVLQTQRRAIFVGENEFGVFLRRLQLVVGIEH